MPGSPSLAAPVRLIVARITVAAAPDHYDDPYNLPMTGVVCALCTRRGQVVRRRRATGPDGPKSGEHMPDASAAHQPAHQPAQQATQQAAQDSDLRAELRLRLADEALSAAAGRLEALLREAARELRPFPPFPGAFFTIGIEVEPDGVLDSQHRLRRRHRTG